MEQQKNDTFWLEELDGVNIYVNRQKCRIEVRLPNDWFGSEFTDWKLRNKKRLAQLKVIYNGKQDLYKYDGQRN